MADALLNKFDLYYIAPDETKMGFLLAKNKYKVKLWRRDDERGLPDSFAPGDISYANLSPDIQKVIAHRYMHGGIGQLEFESEEESAFAMVRSLKTEDVDTRCKGKIYPGPKGSSITTPDCSDGATVADYYSPTSDISKGITNPAAGTHFDDVDDPWDTPDDETTKVWVAYETPVGYETDEYGMATPSGSGTISKVSIIIRCQSSLGTLGVKTRIKTHGTFYTQDFTVPADWTTRVKEYTTNPYTGLAWIWEDFEGVTIGVSLQRTDTQGAECTQVYLKVEYTPIYLKTAWCYFNGKLYAGRGKKVVKYNTDTNVFDEVTKTPPPFSNVITHMEAHGDYMMVALGGTNKYYYMSKTEVFTLGNLTSGEAERFCSVGSKLAQLKLPNRVRLSSNPINGGSWGAEILVGGSTTNVTDMKDVNGVLHCLKQDGPFRYNSTDTRFDPLFSDLRNISGADAGKNSDVSRGGLYFKMGTNQVWEIKDNVLTEITPALLAPAIAEYNYPIVAFAHDESWLYAIMKRGAADFAILAGRWEYVAGRERWVWHEIKKITWADDIDSILACNAEGRPFLYLGSADETDDSYKVYLSLTNDATQDSGYKFHTSGSLWTPRYMTLLFAVQKRWLELFMRSLNLSGTNYINAYYSTDDGASSDLLKKFITSPEQTEAFTNIEATMMNLQFDFVGDSETVPPVLKYHSLKAMTLMPSVVRFHHIVRCASNMMLLKGHLRSNFTATAISAFINTLRDKVCTLGDRDGNEHTVLVRVSNEEEVFDEETKTPGRVYTIEAVKL